MFSTRRFAPRLAAFALSAALLLPAAAGRADDTVLFSSAVPPNVLLVIDNSGSMNEVVWHPSYDPSGDPPCNYWTDAETYQVKTGDPDGSASSTDTNGFAAQNFTLPGSPANCVTVSRNLFADPAVDSDGNYTRWSGKYLNWYYSTSTPAATITAITTTNNGTYSACLGGGTYSLYRRARVTAAKNILKDVICQVNAQGKVRFGLAQFRLSADTSDGNGRDVNGGYVLVPINDYKTTAGLPNVYTLNGTNQSHGDHLDDAIESLEGETNTPLAETLFSVYTYFHSRTTGQIPEGKTAGTFFPKYSYRPRETSGLGGDHDSSGANVPGSPVQYKCQKNFVIIITDGEPTRDDFDSAPIPSGTSQTYQGYSIFNTLIGDYNADGEVEVVGNDPVICGGSTNCEITRYLDDIAKFMHDKDFRPDMTGDQTLDVYTVGFTTTPFANAVLQKTAQVANGQFFFSNSAEALSASIISALGDIKEKSQSFTAATVPASRTADGEQLYVSLFTPTSGSPYWEGHLRSYRLTGSGDIQDANGNCAIDDPGATCFSGPFLPTSVAPPFWDASDEMPAPAVRDLRVSVLRSGAPAVKEFVHQVTPTTTGISTADLGVTFPAVPTPLGSVAANADDYSKELVANIRGCEFGTGVGSVACVLREGQLADIFHSNPVVVGQPVLFEADPSYKDGFKPLVANRQRVIYAGSNGGFLHGFDAGTWQPSATPPQYDVGTGVEVFGFMPWPARQNIRQKPVDTGTRDYYFVDGSPSVADTWLYSSYTVGSKAADGSEWRTVLVGSMRQGGQAYFALDVTNPAATTCAAPATGDGYPCYLWEFPKENDGAAYQNWVAQTWGDAIVTKVRVQVGTNVMERYVAVVTGGYHPTSDPNAQLTYSATATEGRSIWVLDLKTGVPLAWHKFDTAGDCTNPASAVNNTPQRQMCSSLAATPAVYDADGDGFADVIYAGDLGGNIWKWVIKAPLNLSGATTASQPATDWPFRKFFSAPVYTNLGLKYYKSFFFPPAGTRKNGKIWLAFGSGERNDLLFLGNAASTADNNRFYVVEEIDIFDQSTPAPVVTESNLTNLTSTTTCADIGGFRGYYLVGSEGEKWVTNFEIFVGYVIANSYVPPPTVVTDPCEIAGNSFLWAFRVDCGQGLFDGASGTKVRTKDIGAGLPTDPRVTVGAGGDISNRVIVSKQGGDIVNIEAPPGFPQSGSFYWRELPD